MGLLPSRRLLLTVPCLLSFSTHVLSQAILTVESKRLHNHLGFHNPLLVPCKIWLVIFMLVKYVGAEGVKNSTS